MLNTHYLWLYWQNYYNITIYNKLKLTDISPDAIGLFLVLSTSISYFLSRISFTIQPADLINTAPPKNNKQCFKNKKLLSILLYNYAWSKLFSCSKENFKQFAKSIFWNPHK